MKQSSILFVVIIIYCTIICDNKTDFIILRKCLLIYRLLLFHLLPILSRTLSLISKNRMGFCKKNTGIKEEKKWVFVCFPS